MKLHITIDLEGNDLEASDFEVFLREAKDANVINIEVARSVSEEESEVARVFGIGAEYFTVQVEH